MLGWRYRSGWTEWKADPDAEESKLILLALAEVEWNWSPDNREAALANLVFEWIKPIEGFTPSDEVMNNHKAYTAAAKQWLQKNAEKHRVTRYLPNKK